LWRGQNVPEERIVRLDEKDNFWGPAGNSGPCGPCSEIHYDLGKEYGCGKPDCKPGCDCKRFTEIWNLVFPEFNQAEDGTRTKLPKPGIDTGMGLERTAAILQGKSTVYDSDIFLLLLNRVSELAGKKYGMNGVSDNAMRVVVEHGRSCAFLLADGVMPGKEGRGYVLRRILRRAEYFAETLASEKPFVQTVVEEVIKRMGHIYPELVTNRNHIINVIRLEVENFRKALPVGRGMLENIIAEADEQGTKEKKISGRDAFVLHDTYGFPIDLTKEISASRGYMVDMVGFEQEMEKQRERARSARLGVEGVSTSSQLQLDINATNFVGYEQLVVDSQILAIIIDGESVGVAQQEQEAEIVLETTPFYGEMGGQVGDTGEIEGETGHFTVIDTIRINGGDIILHRGKVIKGSLAVEEKVRAEVNADRRMDIARNHTATHLLQYALRKTLGGQVQQRGSLVTPERFRFDFSQLVALSPEQLQQVQRIVNDLVRQDLPVYAEELSYRTAVEEGAIALFDEKYGDVVRALKVGKPPVSIELCGGTHIHSTGQIGFFHIVTESSIGSGLRRIEAVTGTGAEVYFEKLTQDWQEISKAVGATHEGVKKAVIGTLATIQVEKKKKEDIEKELARKTAESLLDKKQVINSVNVLYARVLPLSPQALRETGDFLRDKLKTGIIVLGTVYEGRAYFLALVTQDLVKRGYNAGNIVKQVAEITGGSGGGRPNMAQAGSANIGNVDIAVASTAQIISQSIPLIP
jgi:alanyl-tRNA synthetase